VAGRGEGSGTGSSGTGGGQAFTARARQVVAQWARSPVARVWRSGLVLLSPYELTSIPPNAGFSDHQQKDEFGAGRFTLGGTLPSALLTAPVRWADGATMAVPLLTAQAAFRQLAADQACAVPGCGHLTVIAARPAEP